jgi:hypothetical protein
LQINFITCDGGIAENKEFSQKEQIHHGLIFNQIYISLAVLSENGTLVVKFFDIYTELTFDFIAILSYLFGETYICKPNTSRPTNSEKYIVCKYFKKEKYNNIKKDLEKLLKLGVLHYKSIIRKHNISKEFVDAVKYITRYLAEYQIFNIETIIRTEELNLLINNNCEQVIEDWVKKYY